MAINRTWKSSLWDIGVKPTADVGSDHHLVVAEVKMKLLAAKKPRSTRRKYFTYRLRDQNVREAFVIALANWYNAL